MRGVMRRPAEPAPAPQHEAGEIVVEEVVVEPPSIGSAETKAEPPSQPNANPLFASIPSLEPLVTGLAHSLIDRYGEARIAELLETARTSSPTTLLQSLLTGATPGPAPTTDAASPSAGRFIGGLFSRIGDVLSRPGDRTGWGSLLRDVRAAKARPPAAAETPNPAEPPVEEDP